MSYWRHPWTHETFYAAHPYPEGGFSAEREAREFASAANAAHLDFFYARQQGEKWVVFQDVQPPGAT